MVEGVEGIFESSSTHNRLIEKQLTYRWNEWKQKKQFIRSFVLFERSKQVSLSVIRIRCENYKDLKYTSQLKKAESHERFCSKQRKMCIFNPLFFSTLKSLTKFAT